MLYANDGRLDEHEYKRKCLALQEASCSRRKGLCTLFRTLNPPLPIPINPVYQVVIYIMAHVVPSASPSGPLLRPVSHSYDGDLFHNLLFGLVGPNVTLSQSRFRLWSLINNVSPLEFAFSSP